MDVIIKRKNVKYLRLSVNQDGKAVLSCPYSVSDERIEEFLNKNKDWLERTLKKVYDDTDKYVVADDSVIYILGNPYTIRLITGKVNRVYIDGAFLSIETISFDPIKSSNLLEEYLNDLRIKVYNEILNEYLTKTNERITKLEIKSMKRAYGKCFFKERRIILNKSLIHRTKEFIESVILHEICHLKYPNHQKEFYNYVYSFMPDYDKRQKMLKYQ